MSKHLIIDGGFVCAQAYYTTGHLESSSYDATGVIFGFLSRLLVLARTVDCYKFIFTWDTRKSYRKNAYKAYKESRTKDMTEEQLQERILYYKQVDRLRDEIIPRLGFKNNFYQSGLEADDLIAEVSQNLDGYGWIVSSDQDLYQLLRDNVSMLIPQLGRKPTKLYTSDDFRLEFGISPEDWWKVKAIMGCQSDNVAGIPGVGVKTALKYLKGELSKTSKQYARIKEQWDIVKRNVPLVKLPHKNTKPVSFSEDETSFQEFLNVCEELEFTSFLKERDDWNKVFGGSGRTIRRRLNETRRRKIKR